MEIGLLLLMFIKVLFGFFAIIQIVRLSVSPGFAQMIIEGKRLNKNVFLNNLLLLIGCCVLFYLMSKMGINILPNK